MNNINNIASSYEKPEDKGIKFILVFVDNEDEPFKRTFINDFASVFLNAYKPGNDLSLDDDPSDHLRTSCRFFWFHVFLSIVVHN